MSTTTPRGASEASSRGRRGRWTALVALLASPLVLAMGSARPAHADATGFQLLGGLAAPAGENLKNPSYTGRMAVDPVAHLGAVLTRDLSTGVSSVQIYDLSAIAPVTAVPVPSGWAIADGNNAFPTSVVDPIHHRAFYLYPSGGVGSGCPSQYPVRVLDLIAHTWSTIPIPCPTTPSNAGLYVTTLSYDPSDDSLLMFGVDAADMSTTLSRQAHDYAAAISAEADHTVRWIVPVTACGAFGYESATTAAPGSAIARSGQAIVIACQRSSSSPTAAAYANIAVRIPTGQDGHPVVDATGVPQSVSAVAVGDVGAGYDGGGLFHFVSDVSAYGFGSYVFDTATMEFAGVVATGGGTQLNSSDSIRAFGIDPSSGRIYIRNQKALIVADARHRPLPAGVPYPELADPFAYQGTEVPSHEISVDSVLHRIVVQDLASNSYQVFQDSVPPAPATARSNPDTATTDVAEAPGTTTATYSGSGTAFGLLTLTEGGYDGIVNGIPFACNPGLASSIGPASCPANQLTTPGDRRTFYGHAVQAALTNQDSSTAIAAPIHVDDSATAKDLSTGGADAVPPAVDGAGQQWPADVVQCSDLGTGKKDGDEQSQAGSAHVSCDLAGAAVSSSGLYTGQGDQYQGTVSTVRNADSGELTTSKASAQNISIPVPGGTPLLVREVDASATTQAHGRPGTAAATYTRTIQGFQSPSYSCDTNCDPQQVAAAITQSLTGAGLLAYALAPSPDPAYFPNGTPGGYQAVVAKDRGLRVSEAAVNDDPTDTVAGLEIVYVNDNLQGRSRQIVQFAAVHAESHYGITLLPGVPADGGGGGGGGGAAGAAPPAGPRRAPASVSVTVAGVAAARGATVVEAGGLDHGGSGPVANGSASRAAQSRPAPAPRSAPTAAPAVTAPAVRGGPLGSLWQLLIADPKRAAALAVLWAVLLSPLYLAIRRRALLQTIEAGA